MKTPRKKPARGISFAITSGAGKKLMDGLLMIVADGSLPKKPRRRIAGAPGPMRIERSQWAKLIRRWRSQPDTPHGRRSSPSVADVLAMVIREGVQEEFTVSTRKGGEA